jgi:hypothetical protein
LANQDPIESGQSVPAITQAAPGIRIVVSGGELVESVTGQPDRAMRPKMGEFFWQDAGATRAVRNFWHNPAGACGVRDQVRRGGFQ